MARCYLQMPFPLVQFQKSDPYEIRPYHRPTSQYKFSACTFCFPSFSFVSPFWACLYITICQANFQVGILHNNSPVIRPSFCAIYTTVCKALDGPTRNVFSGAILISGGSVRQKLSNVRKQIHCFVREPWTLCRM